MVRQLSDCDVFPSVVLFLPHTPPPSHTVQGPEPPRWWKLSVTAPPRLLPSWNLTASSPRECDFRGWACDQLGQLAAHLVRFCRISKERLISLLDCCLCEAAKGPSWLGGSASEEAHTWREQSLEHQPRLAAAL